MRVRVGDVVGAAVVVGRGVGEGDVAAAGGRVAGVVDRDGGLSGGRATVDVPDQRVAGRRGGVAGEFEAVVAVDQGAVRGADGHGAFIEVGDRGAGRSCCRGGQP